jgi:hypothetical protein
MMSPRLSSASLLGNGMPVYLRSLILLSLFADGTSLGMGDL